MDSNFNIGPREEKIRAAAKEVIEALRPKKLTVAEVRDVLHYIDRTIESNVRLE